jgi:fermentation-respiration switch protein FrsA (DUF1100 family)
MIASARAKWTAWRRSARGRLILWSAGLLGAWIVLHGCANNLFYYPDREDYGSPAAYGVAFEEVTFPSADGTQLHGWFMPARGPAAGTVIHFHGNAQNISAHQDFVNWLPAEGFNVFTFDYRGYGKSAGRPSRRGVFEDCVAAIRYVRERKDVDPDRLLILGQSLGGANAIAALGSGHGAGVRAIVVDSTFTSYRRIARDVVARTIVLWPLQWPMAWLLVTGDYSPEDYLDKLPPAPIAFLHGDEDEVIPFYHSARLYESAREPKQMWRVAGGHHIDAFLGHLGVYRKKLVEFYRGALGVPAGEGGGKGGT